MLIGSELNNNSHDYSIVNKKYLASYLASCSSTYVKCAAVTIENAETNSDYRVTHNLGTMDIVADAYNYGGSQEQVSVSYIVQDASNIIVHVDKIDDNRQNIRVVVMGAMNPSTATYTKVKI
jgi:hypothetical protein